MVFKWIPHTLSHLMTKKRSFRVSVLALFLSLFAVAFICVLLLTYSKNYQSILSFSRIVANETIEVVDAKFRAMAFGSERVTRISAGFFPTIGPLDMHNPLLLSYLLHVVQNDTHFSSFYIGFPNGDVIQVLNLALSYRRYYVTDPLKPLPSDALFSVYSLNREISPSLNRWVYLNAQLEEVGSEDLSSTHHTYDPRERPWYQGAVKTGQLFWTHLYPFFSFQHVGLSVGNPLFIDGKLAGVIGADLSFSLLADFLKTQKIGKTGQAFILDQEGQLVIPAITKPSALSPELVAQAYQHVQAHPDIPDFIVQDLGTRYLSFITKIPSVFGSDWTIVVIAPLQDFLGSVIKTQNQIVLFILFLIIVSVFILIYFSKKIAAPIVILAHEIHKIKEFQLASKVRVTSSIKEILLLDNAIAALRRAVESFSKYVPKEIVKQLFDAHRTICLGGEKKELTIFFSDIANFTSIAESQPIDVLFPLLTEYFDAMSSIILGLNGTIDKFIGDGIMAFWGAPTAVPDPAHKACEAALICHAMLAALNTQRRQLAQPEFPTRFGIHLGTVIVGNIGTEDRLNYTVIGDAVNATARLQEVDKTYHTSIIISEEVYLKIGKEFVTRPLDVITIKGKTHPIRIYELVGKTGVREDIRPSSEQIDLCTRFTQAYETLQEGHLDAARSLFSHVAQDHPYDFPTKIYLERLHHWPSS